MRLVFIIFFILLSITIVIAVLHYRKSGLSQFCSSDSDCPSNYSCRPNPEEGGKKQCFPSNKLFCSISPTTELMRCPLGATGVQMCNDTCLNEPKFSCVEVSSQKPYVWRQGDQKINIPASPSNYGWCLPDVENKDIECNPYTSDYILE